jgi:lantibiotic modifying enzyme
MSGLDEFKNTACELFRREDEWYIASRRNWIDARGKHSSNRDSFAWCYGGPGMVAARVISRVQVGASPLDGMEGAIEELRARRPSPVDNLCCGNFGRIAAIRAVAAATKCVSMRDAANQLMRSRVELARKRGSYSYWRGSDYHNVSLMTGVSGIGYELLRSQHPGSLPDMLFLS